MTAGAQQRSPGTLWVRVEDAVLGPRTIDPPLRMVLLIFAAMKVLPTTTVAESAAELVLSVGAGVLFVLAIWFPRTVALLSLGGLLVQLGLDKDSMSPLYEPVVGAAAVVLSYRQGLRFLLISMVLVVMIAAATLAGAADSGLSLVGSVGFSWILAVVLGSSAALLESRVDTRIENREEIARGEARRARDREQSREARSLGLLSQLLGEQQRLLATGRSAEAALVGQRALLHLEGQLRSSLAPEGAGVVRSDDRAVSGDGAVELAGPLARTADGIRHGTARTGCPIAISVGTLPVRADADFVDQVRLLMLGIALSAMRDAESRPIHGPAHAPAAGVSEDAARDVRGCSVQLAVSIEAAGAEGLVGGALPAGSRSGARADLVVRACTLVPDADATRDAGADARADDLAGTTDAADLPSSAADDGLGPDLAARARALGGAVWSGTGSGGAMETVVRIPLQQAETASLPKRGSGGNPEGVD